MSDSSRHALFSIAEVTYGTTPATPELKTVRHAGCTLALSKETIKSEEIRANRQVQDLRHGNKQIGGDINTEFSFGSYDDYLEGLFQSTFAAKNANYTAATISAAASDNSLNDSAAGFPALTPGDLITVTGFTGVATTANQANLLVVSRTPSKIVVSGGVALINDAAGESVTIATNVTKLKCGSTRKSFSMLRNFSDIPDGAGKPWHLFAGCEFTKLDMTVTVNAIVKAVFSVIGKVPTLSATAPATSTFDAPTTTSPFDSFSGTIQEGGSDVGVITELTHTYDNGLEARFVVGSPLTLLPKNGEINVSGQSTSYFEDSSILEKFYNETESSISYSLKNSATGKGYRFTFPRIKYTGGQVDVSGMNSITIPFPFTALYDSTSDTTVFVEKIGT